MQKMGTIAILKKILEDLKMNWSNVLPILSVLVPVLLGLWAIMRNIKEEIRSGNAAINNKIDSVKTDLDRKTDNLDHKIDSVKAELKEDINL